jgi:hypothetical protein
MHLLRRHPRGGPRRHAARGPLTALLTLGLLVPLGTAPAAATAPTAASAEGAAVDPGESSAVAAGWIAAQLAATDPTAGELADGILAFAAAGAGADAADAAAARLPAALDRGFQNVGQLAKTVLAVEVVGGDPTDVGGRDLAAELRAELVSDGPDVGRFGPGTQLFWQSLAILALTATDGVAPAAAVDYLADRACDDGTFSFPGTCPDGGSASDVDVTALATQALQAAGRDVTDQLTWLRAQQRADGAFLAYGDPNANSTALGAQTLRAAGDTAAADRAAAYVATLQKGCEAPVEQRGAIATYEDADGSLWLSTTQGVFADAPPLHQLDLTGADADTGSLFCADTRPCTTTGGTAVVVDFGSLAPFGDVVTRCVHAPAAGATGLDLLAAAGFEVTTQDFGGDLGIGLCAIDGLPDLPEGECFDPSFDYWSYWSGEPGGEWVEYQVGAGSTTPAAGNVEGFSWGAFPADPPRVDPPEVVTLPAPPYDRGIGESCPGTYAAPFRDIAGSVHASAVRCLAAADITQGSRDPGLYLPLNVVTRGQLASFLARSFEAATGAPLPAGPDRFPDDDGSPHERNIDALAQAGVVAGVGDGSRFAPNATVTRGQMASLLARFLDLLDDGLVNRSFPPATDRDVFADDQGSVHADATNRLAVQGVVQGRRDGTFGPLDGVRRDQLASFLARALDVAVAFDLGEPVG